MDEKERMAKDVKKEKKTIKTEYVIIAIVIIIIAGLFLYMRLR